MSRGDVDVWDLVDDAYDQVKERRLDELAERKKEQHMSKELSVTNLYGIRGTITHRTDSNVLVITGESGNGKSSFVNSFLHVFAHKAVKNAPDATHNGQDEGNVTFTDDDGTSYTRRWKNGKMSQLEIRTEDGAKYGQPGEILAERFGTITVDVSQFLLVDEKARRELILSKSTFPAGFDLDDANRAQALAESRRTEANREEKRTAGVLASLAAPAPDTPETEQSAADLIGRIQASQANASTLHAAESQVQRLTEQIAQLQAELATWTADAADAAKLPIEDTATLKAQLADIEDLNRAVRARQQYEEAKAAHASAAAAAKTAAAQLEAAKEAKFKALQSAEFPTPSLSVDDEFVLVDGVAWPSVNDGEKSLVALATAIAGEHGDDALKLVILKQGDWLDAKCLARASEMIAAKGFFGLIDRGRPDMPAGVGIDVLELVDGQEAK